MSCSKETETISVASNSLASGRCRSVPTYSSISKGIESKLDADVDIDVAGMGKELSSVLPARVRELSTRVLDVQNLLDKVLFILVTLKDCDDSGKLLDLWSQLCIRFSKLDLRTKEVATLGAQAIKDFLDNICTSLKFAGTPMSVKIERLARYRETVTNMRDHVEAETLKSELRDLSNDFILFEGEWLEFKELQLRHSVVLGSLIAEMQSNLKELKKLFLCLLAQTVFDVGVGAVLMAAGIATHNVLQIMVTSLPIVQRVGCDAVRTSGAFKDIRYWWKSLRTTINHRNKGKENIINGQNALGQCGMQLAYLQLSLDVFPSFWSAMVADLNTLQTFLESVHGATDEIEFNLQLHTTVSFYEHVQEAFFQYGRGVNSFDTSNLSA